MNQTEKIEALLRKKTYQFDDLKDIMTILRSESGCPWDREQTHESIRGCMIEEAYEVIEAIDTKNPILLREELGDVLFQIMFHSQIEFEKNEFSARILDFRPFLYYDKHSKLMQI
jgi:tetrapyrrole methylase family protein/MazG family protein